MEQCVKLERELNLARHEVQEVKSDVIELEKKLNINQLLSQGKISVSFRLLELKLSIYANNKQS